MLSLREIPNGSTCLPPWVLALGSLPRGYAVLKETWCGERELPPSFQKEPTKKFQDMHDKLNIAEKNADLHSSQAQQRYANKYNKRAKHKHFAVHE